ncbi:GNAT family N-acetyltransferase [Adhaeribacter pallidiroseus]|uniref:Phosphinothricin acetyltransferase n=1 Tax=Adhaeribacter pallidiroseus TaxID=2072847 RepID=A0A369QLP2_9BACT|nr:GNAT family N-acetyltransferase [Adhaeribacter pallidiroseus]RDC65292.1 Phosphinothricin acetyltransferase [Adhaeribacter pallidiroseus]
MSTLITPMREQDWPAVATIYREGMATGNATFQKEVPTWPEWDKSHVPDCRFVAKLDEEVVGWAALSPISSRCVYGGVAEVSVYIKQNNRGQRIGENLLKHLVTASELTGFWTLQASIFPENTASIRIHEKAGFSVVGRRERIGKMDDTWRDTILLERRSATVGID